MDNKENVEINLNNSVSIPDECERSTKEIEKISDESVMTHYAFLNVIVLLEFAVNASPFHFNGYGSSAPITL